MQLQQNFIFKFAPLSLSLNTYVVILFEKLAFTIQITITLNIHRNYALVFFVLLLRFQALFSCCKLSRLLPLVNQ